MVQIEKLTFGYGGRGGIFENFSLRIRQGESWSVIGPSGCGKTTLLFLLAGLRKPDAGKIFIAGRRVERPRPETGLVLQDHGLLPWATVRENVRLGLTIREMYGPDGRHAPAGRALAKEEAEKRVDYWLKWLEIDHLQNYYPDRLSRGQRQRTAIARTLVLEPDLLLMDEPFSALDAPIRIELQNIMVRFNLQSRLTSITVTHDIEEAVFLGRKILALCGHCDSEACIVKNDMVGADGFRNDPAFRWRCEQLRELLGTLK